MSWPSLLALCAIHSDRGSQYAGHEFRKILKRHGFIQSMSGKGNCYDNAIMEAFFHILVHTEAGQPVRAK
jgi:transposase InsO family protein